MNPVQGALQQIQQPQQASNVTQQQPQLAALQQMQDGQLDQQDAQMQKNDINAANQQAAVSQALGALNDKSTAGQVGKAIQTPAYAGYCLQYVDDQTGNKNRQPNAISDYQVNAQAGKINNSTNAPKGARVYFNADQSNGDQGHVGLSNGDGTFTSATDNGIKTFSLKDWQSYTGQQFLGWAK